MTHPVPKVSVIIASYQPGEAVHRVIDSLDAQTLPQEEFETIFVDDGSPDDTFARLEQIAATRPNMQVFQIENSGWPSRPRNVGIERARGEYLMFMDHDDSLYPDGLRRAYEYAAANNADVLSPKESKTNDVWWGMSSLTEGNIPNAFGNGGIDRLLPMIPHKLYRRQMFLDHGIRFPEGSRVLWEDIYINVEAYRHADVISVLADTPVYLWHASDTNSSHSFSPSRADFWDRLEEVMEFISTTLDGPDYHDARVTTLAHQVRTRVIDRCIRLMSKPDPTNLKIRMMAMDRAQRLLSRFTSDEVFARLPKKHRAQAFLIHAGEMDLMKKFHEDDLALTAHTTIDSVRWQEGVLHYDATSRWEPKNPAVPGFCESGDRVLRAVDESLERAIPPELLDHTDDPAALVVQLSIRSRAECVTWALPFAADEARFEPNAAGALSLVQHAKGYVDLETAALGRALEDTVWDVRIRTEWIGMERKGPLRLVGPAMPAVVRGKAAIAYANASKGLSIDLAQRLRTFAVDAEPAGPGGDIGNFSVPMANVRVFSSASLDASTVVAIPDAALAERSPGTDAAPLLESLAAEGALAGRIVAGPGGARFEGSGTLAPGSYTLYARREGKLHRTLRSVTVDEGGQATFGPS